jgi:hypothetical protein
VLHFFLRKVYSAPYNLENSLKMQGKMDNYLTANEPEQRVAHIPPMVAPGPANQISLFEQKPQAKITE